MPKSVLSVRAAPVRLPATAKLAPYTKASGLVRTNPKHPCMGSATSAMHDDSYQSDASIFGGPYGANGDVRYFQNTTTRFGGICASFGIDQKGRLLTLSFSRTKTTLLRLDPQTLDPIAAFDLPPRNVKIFDAIFKVDRIFKSTAGAYFCLDDHDRLVIPTVDGEIWIVGQDETAPIGGYFKLFFRMPIALPAGDTINSTMPVWDDRPYGADRVAPAGYWFLTQGGRVGVARPAAYPQVPLFALPNGERVGNSFAVGKKGIFVVSERAIYRLSLVNDQVVVDFRTEYVQGKAKLGQLSPGSGTTPTLLGDRFVAIGDNATVMNVNLYDQDTGKLLDSVPVFADQKGSACENSFVGHGDALIVSNTYGYINPMRWHMNERVPGIVRLDADPSTGKLVQRWYAKDVAAMSAIPKLSLGRGLLYAYTMTWTKKPEPSTKPQLDDPGEWRWSLIGLDFSTGKVVYDQPVFEGRPSLEHDNGWGTIAPGPDDAVYVGMWRGAMRVAAR